MIEPVIQETWSPGRSVPLGDILAPLRRGLGDPTMVLGAHDVWWALTTPQGSAATWWSVRLQENKTVVRLEAAGPGAAWFSGRLPEFLGDSDEPTGFIAHHDLVREALSSRRHRDWRVPKTGLVLNSLVPTVLEQKVTGKQAFAGYRHLVRRFGAPVTFTDAALIAAGSQARRVASLQAPPTAQGWHRVPSWNWLQAGVEPPQSRTVMRICEVATALEMTSQLPLAAAHRRLRSVPGVGIWTAAKVAQTVWGDADTPTFEDYHVPGQIGHALLGRETDDAGMAEILAPYRGHRYRAEHLILAAAPKRSRRGPRMALPDHLPGM